MAKETKYLLADTDEEVLLGDVIVQTLVKNFSNGRRIEREIEFKLTEETVPYALDMGLIEEAELENKEEENENGLLDFGNEDCPFEELLNRMLETQEDFEKKLEAFEEKLEVLVKLMPSEKKTASSKKK